MAGQETIRSRLKSENCALIDQTMLCDASRLFAVTSRRADDQERGDRDLPRPIERLFHLSVLLDVVAMYDRIYVLRGELPEDADDLLLRKKLFTRGIVHELDVSEISDVISSELSQLFTRLLRRPKYADQKISDLFVQDLMRSVEDTFCGQSLTGLHTDPRYQFARFLDRIVGGIQTCQEIIGDVVLREALDERHLGKSRNLLSVIADAAIHAMAKILTDGAMTDPTPPPEESSLHSSIVAANIRTLIYWRCSEYCNIPFYPSWQRTPQYYGIYEEVLRSTGDLVYKEVAAAFRVSEDEVRENERPLPVALPPGIALFLEKYRERQDLDESLDHLLERSEEIRKALRDLQSDLRTAETLGDRNRAKLKLRSTIDSIGTEHKVAERSNLQELIGHAPEILKPLSNLDRPADWVSFLGKSAGDIQQWWLNRPVRMVSSFLNRLPNLARFHDLMEDALNLGISREEAGEFETYYDTFLNPRGVEYGGLPDEIAPSFAPPQECEDDFGGYRSPRDFYDGTPVRTPADWQRRREEILGRWNAIMGPWPALLEEPAIDYVARTRRRRFSRHQVRVEIAPDGRRIDGYLLMPDGQGPFPAILAVYYDPDKTAIDLEAALKNLEYALVDRGFVTLSVGTSRSIRFPNNTDAQLQPLSAMAYAAANCCNALALLDGVDPERIGIVGHAHGGRWAMFASCLYERFACAVWSEPGLVFDESRPDADYWERWSLGYDPNVSRTPGLPSADNPRTGAYRKLLAEGYDLHELHALMAPRPFLVLGGSVDPPERWKALNHTVAVNKLLGRTKRVAMINRKGPLPTPESNEQTCLFFEHFLKPAKTGDRYSRAQIREPAII